MKTLKSIALGLVILLSFGAAKAADKVERLSKTFAISTYIDAMSHGKLQGLNDVLDATAKFSMLRGTQVTSFGKAEMLGFVKENKDIEQTCTVSTTEMETNNDISVVKVDMKYNGFTRSNYVTVANTGAGWKITNVYTVFSN